MISQISTHRQKFSTGSSLIEVLVAALILSFGMLSMIGLQGAATQMNKITQFRAEASRLSMDYVDRVKANRTAIANYLIADSYTGAPAAQTVPTTCQAATECSGASLAALDVAEMRERVRTAIPQGAFYVTQQTNAGSTVLDVWVLWQAATTKTDGYNTTDGIGCPSGVVSATGKVQCLLTRFAL